MVLLPRRWHEIIALLDSESGKYIQSPSHRIIKNRNWLIIAPNEVEKSEIVIIDGTGDWQSANGNLKVEMTTDTNAISQQMRQASNFHSLSGCRGNQISVTAAQMETGRLFLSVGDAKEKKAGSLFYRFRNCQKRKRKSLGN